MNHEIFDIVIVEDNPNDAELTVRALWNDKITHNLTVLEDGEQALDYLFCKNEYADRISSDPPKVIFLDIKIPKISGLEVLKKIKSDDRTKRIPAIMLTSSKQDRDIEAAYNLGANSYIVKPVDFDKFTETITYLGLYWLGLNEYPDTI